MEGSGRLSASLKFGAVRSDFGISEDPCSPFSCSGSRHPAPCFFSGSRLLWPLSLIPRRLSLRTPQCGQNANEPSTCKTNDRIKAEYALRDIAKPIGVAQWQTKLVQSLPEPLKGSLPSIEEIEAELGKEEGP